MAVSSPKLYLFRIIRIWSRTKTTKTSENSKKLDNEANLSNKPSDIEGVKSEDIWVFHYKNVDSEGNENYIYRYKKKVKACDEQCKEDVSLKYSSNSENILLCRSQLSHTCKNENDWGGENRNKECLIKTQKLALEGQSLGQILGERENFFIGN